MATQKEMLEAILTDQQKQGKLLQDIDTCLRGPEYDPADGGLVAEVHKNTLDVHHVKKKQTKIITWAVTLLGAINIVGLILLLITRFKDVLP